MSNMFAQAGHSPLAVALLQGKGRAAKALVERVVDVDMAHVGMGTLTLGALMAGMDT